MTNKHTSKTTRNVALPPHFDMARLRSDVAADDAERNPSQEDLATMYANHPDIIAMSALYPHSLEAIVKRIAEQDPRFVAHGRKLLKQMLRDGADRHARKGRPGSPARPKATSIAPEAPPAIVASRANASTSMPSFLEVSTAEMYGG